MKGIILAGGNGTRLYPITKGISKHLLPIYDKPMIYYPLSVLMLSGIKEILIISTPKDLPMFQELLGDGSDFGITLYYKEQASPDGLAQAFLIGESFIEDKNVCLILGDNIFYGHALVQLMQNTIKNVKDYSKATVFGYYVNDPERYGVVEFDQQNKVISIEEKPIVPKSNYAVTGLYFYPNDVISKAKLIKPSSRGELEITTLNQIYLQEDRLNVELMGRGFAWLDTGTHESLIQASLFIQTIEERQSLKIACLEEIAYSKGYINKEQLLQLAKPLLRNQYGHYLADIADKIF